MRCGLFGKLPAKRDFVTVAAPRAFLRLVEPWLERGLAESRRRLPPEDWAHLFLSAPAWRFWLAASLCHKTVLGAFIPSMDACGRLFPLIVFGVAEEDEKVSPPFVDPHGAWFERAEALLAAGLDPEAPFEATTEALADLCCFRDLGSAGLADPHAAEDEAVRERLARLVDEQKAKGLAVQSCWWTFAPDAPEPLDHDGLGPDRSEVASVIEPEGSVQDAGEKPPRRPVSSLARVEADMPDPMAFTEMLAARRMPWIEPAIGVTS